MARHEHFKHLREKPEMAAVGTKWTESEEVQLIESIASGIEIKDIAGEHKRTVGGIASRLREIAVRMIEIDGKTVEDVCSTLRLSKDEVLDARNRRMIAKKSKPETEMDILNDVRRILLRIESKLFNE